MGEMVVFSVLLILGLFLLFNGQKSLKKFKEYNQQWHNIALYYQQTKNGADLRYIDFVVDADLGTAHVPVKCHLPCPGG